MATGVGLLCSRVRVEEKGILAALTGAGVPGCAVPPSLPLPAPLADAPTTGLVVDRLADRTAAGVLLGLLAAQGIATIDAGLAARRDRVEVALALQRAGMPTPAMQVAIGEDAALATVAAGGPCTLMPLVPGEAGIALHDTDTAEAVFEHRAVLGGRSENVFVLLAGAPLASERAMLTVVGGTVAGVESAMTELPQAAEAFRVAARAARALRADLVGIELTWTASGWLVWDVVPVPDFRAAVPVGTVPVATAVADLAASRLAECGSDAGHEIVAVRHVAVGGVVDGLAAAV